MIDIVNGILKITQETGVSPHDLFDAVILAWIVCHIK